MLYTNYYQILFALKYGMRMRYCFGKLMMYVGDGKEYVCTFEYQSSFTFQEGELE